MRAVKYLHPLYRLYDYQAVERWLTRQAAKGWRVEKAGAFLWRFRRTEPAQVTYAVTYLEGVSMFSPRPNADQRDLEDLCAAAGWTKAADWLQMQIFSNDAEAPVPLETDEAVRLDAIHRSMWRSLLPCQLLLVVLLLLLCLQVLARFEHDPLYTLASSTTLLSLVSVLAASLSMGAFFLGYFLWLRRSRRSIDQGGGCASTTPLRVLDWIWNVVLCLLLLAMPLSLLCSARPELGVALLLEIPLFALAWLAIHRTREILRDRGSRPAVTIALMLLVDVALVAALTVGRSHLTQPDGWLAGQFPDPPVQEAVLAPADLTDSQAFGDCWVRCGSSPLLSHHIYWYGNQDPGRDLSYTLTASPWPWLQNWALHNYLNTPGQEDNLIVILAFNRHSSMPDCRWETAPAGDWQAEAVWQLWNEAGPLPIYLLQYPDRISRLHLPEVPTAAQKRLIHDRLLLADLKTGGLPA